MAQNWLNVGFLQRVAVLGAVLALSAPLAPSADAARFSRQGHSVRMFTPGGASHDAARSYARVMTSSVYATQRRYTGRYAAARFGISGGRLQCVPFARENSGIELTGNAHTWWDSAEGVYERGARPEVGSVLNFRSHGRMRLGHVAVVSNVIDGRTLAIDHANWGTPGSIVRNVTVVDVSESNDWSAVRVALGDGGFGSVYPTHGFIYDRPDRGTMLANTGTNRSPAPMLAAAPRDLRSPAERILVSLSPTMDEEVAEAPDDRAPRMRYASSRRFVATSQRGSFRTAMRGREAVPKMVSLRARMPVAAAASRNRVQVAAPSSRRDAAPVSAKRGKNRT